MAILKKHMILKRGIEIGSVNMIQLVTIWEVANGKILVLLFKCW